MTLFSNATGTDASMMLESTYPVRKSALSSLMFCSASCLPTSGLNWSSPTIASAGRPPSLPPFSFTASRKASRMSMPSAALGIDIRDAFLLAVKLNGGRLGGLPAEAIVGDDQFKPDVGRQLAEQNIKLDKADFLTGYVLSNIMLASVPVAFENKVIYVSPNAAPSPLAGKQCNPYFFAASWPNDAYHEAAGQYATTKGYQAVYMLAPNYQAGKDSLEGFKRFYKGRVAGEVYTQLGQLDYSAELAQVRAAKPEAVYIFLPGGMGVNFFKQFVAA